MYKRRTLGEYLTEKLPLIMAFLIPVLILLVLYIGREIFPFGDNTYLRSDMYHQYAPFMKEFQRNIQNGGSFLYSWEIGLGTNFASTYAYYLASPFNWLVGLFPNTLVPEFMNLMILLKSGAMSALFAWYLIRKYRRNDYIATVFGCFYAMSAYMAAFSWNVMWLDCLVLLPLILMGLEKMVREGRCRMYIITLSLSVLSNYYISIMISFFLIFYFIYLMICESKEMDLYDIAQRICLFIVSSLIAACISMVIILPALFNLFITASADSSFPTSMTAYYNLLEMMSKAVINVEPAVFSGHFPNIYSTMALFMLLPLFWISKRIPAREKAGKTILIALLSFSFMFNVPTYIWHGFHFPNSLPCRYSFIFILLVLVMGYQALINIRRFREREIVICAAVGIAMVFLLQALYPEDNISLENACLGAAFIVLYLIVAMLLKKKRDYRPAIMILLMVFSIAEILINTNATAYSTTSRTYYYADNEAIADMLEQVDDGSFYRVERYNRKTKNDGTWNNYKSASVFSSTTVAGNSDLYNLMGMQGRINAYSYSGHSPFTQALLGVKYEIASEILEDPLMTLVASSGDYYLYENKYALSLGFMANKEVLDIVCPVSEPFTVQNFFIEGACGISDVFAKMPSSSGERAAFDVDADGKCLIYLTSDIESCVVEITRNGEVISNTPFDSLEIPEVIDVGEVRKGDIVTVSCNESDVHVVTAYPAVMDYEKYDAAMETLAEEQLNITDYSDTYIRGTVTASEGKILFTTVPFDQGWTMYVDGEKTEYSGFYDSFIVAQLDPGEHTVELRYWPMGLSAGIIVSIIGLIAFLLFDIFVDPAGLRNRIRRRREYDHR